MYKADVCTLCGDCLVKCQWMEVDRDQAVAFMTQMRAGQTSPALDKCITCYACNEICPVGANPFDLKAELMEKFGLVLKPQDAMAQEARYLFTGTLTGYPQGHKRIMSVCVFGKSEAHLMEGPVYDLPRVGGKPYFCWVLFSHMGAPGIQERHAREVIDRLAMTGAEEVVCFHDDCYALLTTLAREYGLTVPFRPIHLAEYLVEYVRAHQDRIKPLNVDLAYQRPCASRHTPEKEHFIDELFQLLGARRVPRAYDREKALCCAGTKFLLGRGDPRPDQEKNVLDAKTSGARAIVYLCPVCHQSLSAVATANDLPMIFIGNLVRMALGEMPTSF